MKNKFKEKQYTKAFVIYIMLVIFIPLLVVINSAFKMQLTVPEGNVLRAHPENGKYVCTFNETRSRTYEDYCNLSKLITSNLSYYAFIYIISILLIGSVFETIHGAIFVLANILVFFLIVQLISMWENKKQKNKI